MLGQKQWREELQYDAITCMFAIHYFFESEKAIKTFLHNVSINLREGNFKHCLNPPSWLCQCSQSLSSITKPSQDDFAFFHFDTTCLALAVCC